MIYQVTARNPKNELLDMVLTNPEKSGINVKNITGITPVGAEIYITPFGTIDGGIYAGSRVPSRNVVLTLGMWPKEYEDGTVGSIEESRLTVYNFFRIKDPIDLVFYTDYRTLILSGYVEDVDVGIFSESETATVSVICVDPWFKTPANEQVGFSGIRGEFEFPFSSEQGSENWQERIEFGYISVDTRTEIDYIGDIAVGFRIHISFLGMDFHNIYIYNMDTRERLNIYTDQIEAITGYPLDKGDELFISTVTGKKSAYLMRNGEMTNVISMVDKNSDWFKLTKGKNVFAFATDYGVENIVMTLSYEDSFAGI